MKVLDNFFGETVWVIHLLGWSVIGYKLNSLYGRMREKSVATKMAGVSNGELVVEETPKEDTAKKEDIDKKNDNNSESEK